MPGIVGLVSESRYDSERLLVKMSQVMMHEEFYQVDSYASKNVGLARIHLGAINKKSQPAFDNGKALAAVMDGEVYNWSEFNKELHNKVFVEKTHSHAKMMLHSFKKYGQSFIPRLNGNFIFALYDAFTKKLLIINDRYGLKPLYYTQIGRSLLFASEVKALLQVPELKKSINFAAVADFFSLGYIQGNKTFIEAIHMLPHGSILTYSDDTIKINRYWDYEYKEDYPERSESEYIEELGFLLRQAADRQTLDGHPFGVSLSGGLDSRLIAGLLSKKHTIHTFTFGSKGTYDVISARKVAKKIGSHHHVAILDKNYLKKYLKKGVWLSDGMLPCNHFHNISTLSEGQIFCKVVFNGLFGDVLWGSYVTPYLLNNNSHRELEKRLYDKKNAIFKDKHLKEVFLKDIFVNIKGQAYAAFRETLKKAHFSCSANKSDYYMLKERMRRFILYGQVMADCYVRCRFLFFDNDVVDFALKIPPSLRHNEVLYVKTIIKELPELSLIPWEKTGLPLRHFKTTHKISRFLFLQRERAKRKLSFLFPQSSFLCSKTYHSDVNFWFRSNLRKFVESILLDEKTLSRGYFNPESVRTLLRNHMSAKEDNTAKIGTLLTFEMWHRLFWD